MRAENAQGTWTNLFSTKLPTPVDFIPFPQSLSNAGHTSVGGALRAIGGHPQLDWDASQHYHHGGFPLPW